ncbi:MAG: SRPBCC domain-containing protein [Proteobacteria bacterium]|nr:SRPBCC domain-containing protein [Pseudomonadota bacterium]
MAMVTDRIEHTTVLAAPLAAVWAAVSEADRFGSWFGVAFDGPFVAGRRVTGRITPTTVDPEIARLQEPHAGKRFEFWVEQIDPPRSIVFRWHPFAIDPAVDYSGEPTTRIAIDLAAMADGTGLRLTESGFEALPAARRAAAYQANDSGWVHQLRLIERYLRGS